jgi:transposase
VKYLEQQLAEVERKINELMQQSEELSAARKLLMGMPGVGPVTANILLIRLPEIRPQSRRSAGWTRADGQPERQ